MSWCLICDNCGEPQEVFENAFFTEKLPTGWWKRAGLDENNTSKVWHFCSGRCAEEYEEKEKALR